jgi:hypothetical protein
MSNQQILLDSICEFRLKETNETIPIVNKKINFLLHKYSSKKTSTWKIEVNDVPIKKDSKYLFKYRCHTCLNEHIISSTQMIRKINKGSLNCYLCKNKDETMIQKRKETLLNQSPKKLDKHKSLTDIKQETLLLFNSLDDDEKSAYYSFHLTVDEFERIRKNLISLGNDKFPKEIINRLEYWDIFKSNNQMKFTSVFYDPKENIIIKKDQPKFKCDNCDLIWMAKHIESVKNQYKVLCPSCKLVNKTFKKRNIKNINEEKLLYQSKLEKKFVDWCNDKGLLIINGPKLEYLFGDKKRTYHLDFELPSLKILIEIKDDHIWHLNEIKSGIWECKQNAAENYVKENKYDRFILLTPKNWIEKTKELFNLHKLIISSKI